YLFFQAEDGIRDFHVTGVQTCALPISNRLVSACITSTILCRRIASNSWHFSLKRCSFLVAGLCGARVSAEDSIATCRSIFITLLLPKFCLPDLQFPIQGSGLVNGNNQI